MRSIKGLEEQKGKFKMASVSRKKSGSSDLLYAALVS